MSALSGHGCTHHGPLLAYTTICCPGRAPETRPAMVSTLSRPPCAAGGILVNATTAFTGTFCVGHPLHSIAITANATICQTPKLGVTRVCGFMSGYREFAQIAAGIPESNDFALGT